MFENAAYINVEYERTPGYWKGATLSVIIDDSTSDIFRTGLGFDEGEYNIKLIVTLDDGNAIEHIFTVTME